MTHGPLIMSDEERKEAWITDGLIRLRFNSSFFKLHVQYTNPAMHNYSFNCSVGIEDCGDIIADLTQALDKIKIDEE